MSPVAETATTAGNTMSAVGARSVEDSVVFLGSAAFGVDEGRGAVMVGATGGASIGKDASGGIIAVGTAVVALGRVVRGGVVVLDAAVLGAAAFEVVVRGVSICLSAAGGGVFATVGFVGIAAMRCTFSTGQSGCHVNGYGVTNAAGIGIDVTCSLR